MGHPVSGSPRPQPQPQPQPKPAPDEDHGNKKQPKPVPNEDHGDKKYDGKGPVRNEYAHNDGQPDTYNNGAGKEGFEKNQENISDLPAGIDGTRTEPDDKKDRVDAKGYVYTWDPDANGSKGAWGVAGKTSADAVVRAHAGEDISEDIEWYDDESYERASGLSYEDDGSGGYDPEADKV
jgi:hypothetical protein